MNILIYLYNICFIVDQANKGIVVNFMSQNILNTVVQKISHFHSYIFFSCLYMLSLYMTFNKLQNIFRFT